MNNKISWKLPKRDYEKLRVRFSYYILILFVSSIMCDIFYLKLQSFIEIYGEGFFWWLLTHNYDLLLTFVFIFCLIFSFISKGAGLFVLYKFCVVLKDVIKTDVREDKVVGRYLLFYMVLIFIIYILLEFIFIKYVLMQIDIIDIIIGYFRR